MLKNTVIKQLEELIKELKESSAENVEVIADTYYQGKMKEVLK